jgi:hypothetical protein
MENHAEQIRKADVIVRGNATGFAQNIIPGAHQLGADEPLRAGVPVLQHQHTGECQHGCAHAAYQLLAGIEAARNRFAGFWGLGCDCFAF